MVELEVKKDGKSLLGASALAIVGGLWRSRLRGLPRVPRAEEATYVRWSTASTAHDGRSIVTYYRRVTSILGAVAASLVLLVHLPLAVGHEPQPGREALVDQVVLRFLLYEFPVDFVHWHASLEALVMLHADEALTFQILTGYTSVVELMNAQCSW
jgi:hypothetical protein